MANDAKGMALFSDRGVEVQVWAVMVRLRVGAEICSAPATRCFTALYSSTLHTRHKHNTVPRVQHSDTVCCGCAVGTAVPIPLPSVSGLFVISIVATREEIIDGRFD